MSCTNILISVASILGPGAKFFEPKYLAILALLLYVLWSIFTKYTSCDVNTAPTVGVAPGTLGPFKAPYRWKHESQHLILEGMSKYGNFGQPFKIRTPSRWMTFITNPTILQELKALPVDILSYRDSADEMLQTDYILQKGLMKDAWHIEGIRKNHQIFGYITETASMLLPESVEEVAAAWNDYTNISNGDEWTEIYPFDVMVRVIARATNRVYVGLPLCRNEEYLDSMLDLVARAASTMSSLDMTPRFLQPFIAKLVYRRDKRLATILKHVGPIFEERIRQMDSNGGVWKDETKPKDVFQWIIDAAPPNTSVRSLALSLVFFNMSSIHTTGITITHALFDLAANPSYQQPLREEMEKQLAGGWTSQALVNMRKTDSVLRESARMNGANVATIMRKVLVPHTFSDGTHVTRGSWVFAPSAALHRTDKLYDFPDVFDGFRGYRQQKEQGVASKFHSTTASDDHLPFGHGLSTCPGRFFATNEMKIILAHVLRNYDFKFIDGVRERPRNLYDGIACFPDPSVPFLFRDRRI